MNVAAVQYASIPGDIVANVKRHVAFVERAAASEAAVLVFPELSLIGYEPHLAAATATTPDDTRLAPAICFEALQREHVDAVVALGATTYLVSVAKHARGVAEAHELLAAGPREHRLTVVLANAVGPFAVDRRLRP